MDSMPRLGAIVSGPGGSGVVSDRAWGFAEVLVRLAEGTVLDTTHGCWYPIGDLTATGFDPDAEVWYANRVVPARTVPVPGEVEGRGVSLVTVDWHVYAAGRWQVEEVPVGAAPPVNVYVAEERMAPVEYRHQAGTCTGTCVQVCGHPLTYGCDCGTIAAEMDAQEDVPHTCGPGINWGCDNPDCDGGVGD